MATLYEGVSWGHRNWLSRVKMIVMNKCSRETWESNNSSGLSEGKQTRTTSLGHFGECWPKGYCENRSKYVQVN